tara:strand:- start:730 stop:1191 length:462 start_codon:yes stop_codon:yes gene_type:complete
MTTTPPTNPLCKYINDQEDEKIRDLMIDQLVIKRIKNKHGKSERVNLCEKLKKFEDILTTLEELKVTPEFRHASRRLHQEYITFNEKLNNVIRLLHEELNDISTREELAIGGKSMKRKSMKRKFMKRKSMKPKSMKRKSMKRKSMKRKYSKHN